MKRFVTLSLGIISLLFTAVAGFAQQLDAKNQYAFIIGIDHYDDQSISTLASCRLDALRFETRVTHQRKLDISPENVALLLDPTKAKIEKALTEFLGDIENPELSSVYFYYSGHGIPGGIIPANYDQDNPLSMLSYSWIKNQISASGIANSIYVIDACYSGSILKAKANSTPSLEHISVSGNTQQTNTVIFTATNAYRVTPAGKHQSVYSRYFLDALDDELSDLDNNGIVTAGELNKQIQNKLGDIFEPQFYGTEEFPILNTTAKVIGKRPVAAGANRMVNQPKVTAQAVVKGQNYVNPLVVWRSELEKQNWSVNEIRGIIDSLKRTDTPESLAKIGFIYRNGIGVAQDYNKALAYFISARPDECGFAAYNLGYLYSYGYGLKQDEQKALKYYKTAAHLGDPYGQNNLGIAYSVKRKAAKDQDYDLAIKWLTLSATQGFVNAQSTLGILLKDRARWTIKPKKKKELFTQAAHWLSVSANSGYGLAQFELANSYALGHGVKKNDGTARNWYIEACKNQELRACRKVMTMDHALTKD